MAISDYSATDALNITVPGSPAIQIGKGIHSPQGHDIQRQAIQRLMADLKTFHTALGGLDSLAKTDGNFVVGDGSGWVAESGATARASLGLGSAAVLDAGTAENNLKQLNADGGFSFATTATPTINIDGVFGGTWETSHRFHSAETGATNSGTYVTTAIMREAEGLSASGATNSNIALWVESEKTDYLTSTTEGQTLGQYTVVRHGRLGDGAGLLLDARKTYDGTYDGSILGIEALVAKVNSSGTITQHIQCYMGWGMSATGTNFASDSMAGFVVEPRVAETFAAFAAVERSDLSGPPVFEHVFASSTNRDSSNIFVNITGTGNAAGAGRVHVSDSASFPGVAKIGDTNSGLTWPAADQVGFSCAGTTRFWATTAHINTTVPLRYNAVQVLAGRVTGFTTAAGTANKDASGINVGTITATDGNIQAVAAWVKSLHDALATHGIIGA